MSADGARESARQSDGKFGIQPFVSSGDVNLAGVESTDGAAGARGGLDEWASREIATQFLESYTFNDAYPQVSNDIRMGVVAKDLLAYTSAPTASSLSAAIRDFENTSINDFHYPVARHVLHAELSEAATAGVPTRADVQELRHQLDRAYEEVKDAVVARDIGNISTYDVQVAVEIHDAIKKQIEDAERDRHMARLRRVARGNPTLYDVQDADLDMQEARSKRRVAVNAADWARDAVTRFAAADENDLLRRTLSLADATERERGATAAYERAQHELEVVSTMWHSDMNGSRAA